MPGAILPSFQALPLIYWLALVQLLKLYSLNLPTGRNYNKSVLGVATGGGNACDQNQSNCVIITARDMKAGLVLAHEIGHSLGVHMHVDETRTPCQDGIMLTYLNVYSWSNCTNIDFNNWANSTRGWCVHNITGRGNPPRQFWPGDYYPVDRQCQKAFGTKFKWVRGDKLEWAEKQAGQSFRSHSK